MVAIFAYPLAIIPSKLAIIKSQAKSIICMFPKSASFNVPSNSSGSQSKVVIENKNKTVLYPSPLKKSSVTHHEIPFQQYELQQGLENVRKKMARNSNEDDQLEELIIIDAIQRLGLECYFQDEIHAAMERHYFKDCGDLHEVALRFRLLRQQGYNVTSDVFNKFKDDEGNFKPRYYNDLRGLLSLFEASHLSTGSENIMDEAREYSEQVLKASLATGILEQDEAKKIEYTLRSPYHKGIARILPKNIFEDLATFLEFLHGSTNVRDWVKDVQDIARIDFDMAQTTHRDEILQVSRWGKEQYSTTEMGFARIQPFKWYMWSLGLLPTPNMVRQRVELAKVVSFVYIIDDIFDVYGTIDELSLFAKVVNRWDYANVEQLPDCMKVCFKALQDLVKDISKRTSIMYGWNPEDSLRKAWGDLCNSFLMEAKWLESGQLPSSEDYLKNGMISSSMPVVLMHTFFLLGQGISETSVDALNELPSIVSSPAIVIRLWNDIGTDKDENREGKDGSYIDCYMKEHKDEGRSVESGTEHAKGLILNAWKRLNEELLSPTSPFSVEFKTACLNAARMATTMYSIDNTHHLQELKQRLNLLIK